MSRFARGWYGTSPFSERFTPRQICLASNPLACPRGTLIAVVCDAAACVVPMAKGNKIIWFYY